MRSVWVLWVAVLVLAGCSAEEVSGRSAGAEPERPAVWDPRDVDELPTAGPEVAPGLPARVTPPEQAPSLATEPLAAAVLTVDRRRRGLLLLGTDGSWRAVRPGERYGRASLSPGGARLAILLSDRIEMWHLPTGRRSVAPLPSGFRPWDFARVGWLDDSTLLLDDYATGWRIDVASGDAERAAYPRRSSWTVDPDGVVLEVAGPARPPSLIDWADGTPRRVDLAHVGTTQQVRASAGLVAGTAYADGRFQAFVLDRERPDDLTTLRLRDFEGNYSNWALRVADVLHDGSVLLWVAVPGRSDVDGWRLVRWDPATDVLETVTASEADPTWSLSFATDLLEVATDVRGH